MTTYCRRHPISMEEAQAVLPLLAYRYITDVTDPYPLSMSGDYWNEVNRSIRVLKALVEMRSELEPMLGESIGTVRNMPGGRRFIR